MEHELREEIDMGLSSVWQVRGKGGDGEGKERESGCGFDGCCSGTNQSACLTLETLLCECTRTQLLPVDYD